MYYSDVTFAPPARRTCTVGGKARERSSLSVSTCREDSSHRGKGVAGSRWMEGGGGSKVKGDWENAGAPPLRVPPPVSSASYKTL